MVGFKANQIHSVPAASLTQKLRWLILTDNNITELPDELSLCQNLQKLMLAGNQLKSLPNLSSCNQLELIRIAANQFDHLPDWLLDLPRLAWLGYSGNPCTEIRELNASINNPTQHIDWQRLVLLRALGEGASGVIYHATCQIDNTAIPVAVKLFKGTLTSDGYPRSEKAARIAGGEHPVLIPILGEVTGNPTGEQGLVMPLMQASYINLAGPPDLESCTRDCYLPGTRFSLFSVLKIALKLALAAQHLHERGIMHGDLYAHNILWDQQDDIYLGDFGAASFTIECNGEFAAKIQQIEVRAFACILDELLNRCDSPGNATHIVSDLRALQQRCDAPVVSNRPLFLEICSILKQVNPV
jgi:hypothetical protein